jgi:hypothetical protein
MAIRQRFALGLTGLCVTGLTTLGALAMAEATPRSIDVVVLWLAGLLSLGLLLTWILIPRLPRWIVAGFGLILIATGLGVIVTAPVPAGAGTVPWALIGLVVAGLAIIIAAAVHGSQEARALS